LRYKTANIFIPLTDMWTAKTTTLHTGTCLQLEIFTESVLLSYADVVDLWQTSEAFRSFYLALLAEAPFAGYFWEALPVTQGSVERPYQFVLVNSPTVAGLSPNSRPFAPQFAANNDTVIAFDNLGGDATLIVPREQADVACYPHLAAFVRGAPLTQQHDLLQKTGAALAQRLRDTPIWVSTSGLGVSWLHVRLDSRPKYYTYTPYKRFEG
jgi:hypothetical protein